MNTRGKGVAFEHDVAKLFTDAGFTVRGLEAGGDHFAITTDGQVWHIEAKRHERPRISEWLRQQERDCPPVVRRLLVWKQSRRPVYAIMPLEQLLALLGESRG